MITIFNRKELLITYDMERCFAVRNRLADAGIDYIVRTKSPVTGGSRTTVGIDLSAAYEYRIFVRRADFENARRAIG